MLKPFVVIFVEGDFKQGVDKTLAQVKMPKRERDHMFQSTQYRSTLSRLDCIYIMHLKGF